MGCKRTEKIDRALKRLDRCFWRVGKVCRWLNTTNDVNRDSPEWAKELRMEASSEMISAMGHLQYAEMRMMALRNWMAKRNHAKN